MSNRGFYADKTRPHCFWAGVRSTDKTDVNGRAVHRLLRIFIALDPMTYDLQNDRDGISLTEPTDIIYFAVKPYLKLATLPEQ